MLSTRMLAGSKSGLRVIVPIEDAATQNNCSIVPPQQLLSSPILDLYFLPAGKSGVGGTSKSWGNCSFFSGHPNRPNYPFGAGLSF